MRRSMKWLTRTLTATLLGSALLLGAFAPVSEAQFRRRVIVVEPVGPFFPYYAYPYPYPGYYMYRNYGEVKIETYQKHSDVYVDGGYAGNMKKSKKFALRPGTHEIELRNSDGATYYSQRVTVLVGETTKLHVS
jgi:PEGA domain